MPELLPLTGLRIWLALWVVMRHLFHHYPGESGINLAEISPGWLTPFVTHGYLGVDGFFVLSGFILSYTYRSQFLGFDLRIY